MGDSERHAVATTATTRRVDRANVRHTRDGWKFNPICNSDSVNGFLAYEALNVGTKLREIFGPSYAGKWVMTV
jgi:hypothetical protein